MQVLIQLARQALLALGIGGAAQLAIPGDQPFLPFGGGGGGGDPLRRRRRRRKALTADDVRLSLIISTSISKKAAENFILQRVRPS